MSESYSAVWNQVERLVNEGLSLIPIRDKQEGEYAPKSPYNKWKDQQYNRYDMPQIWQLLEERCTNAVGIVCGEISGNLEVIDIDNKHKPGIEAHLFNDIKTLYPDLLDKLRIHKTPSGGYHIIYRCTDKVEGNLKLAGRNATEEELSGKPKQKVYHFLETRGNGGYIAAPPSLGYKIVKDNPIPVITPEERAGLLTLCRNYDEQIKIEKTYKATKTEDNIYDEDPFIDFNNRCDAVAVAEGEGWVFVKQNSHFAWFTRPGGTKKNTHLSWNFEKRFFYCFTASTALEPSKGYTPAIFVGKLRFNDDRKQLYAYLVNAGYGKVKAKVEQRIIKNAAIAGTSVQANFSEQAKAELTALTTKLQEQHPFGIFWERDEDDKIAISRERLYNVAEGLGFRSHKGDIVQIVDKFIHYRDERYFYDAVKQYIQEEDADLYEDICNSYESFIQRSGKFTIERIPLLPTDSYIEDSRTTCNKFYSNGYLEIAAAGVTFHPYTDLPLLVFHNRIQHREYNEGSGGRYVDFLEKACELSVRKNHIQSIIGFLSHEYKDETTGFIIILTEQCQDPKAGGGSGKNVFCNLLKNTTTYISKAGAQTKYDEKFFQIWNGERIFAISDAPEHFDFLFLKEPATGDIVQKKLFKDEHVVNVKDSPKFIVQTNYTYEVSDGGLRRRMHAIEFTDFFTRCGGVDVHYGCHFPLGWTTEDWAGYDNFIAQSVQYWIAHNLKITPSKLTETGWQKQFEHTYGVNAANYVRAHWDYWKRAGWISNERFKQELEAYYNENGIAKTFQPSMIKLNNAISDWCEKHNYHFGKDVQKWTETGNAKGRSFEENAPF